MLAFLRTRESGRKLRLFALACCERVADLIADQRSRAAILFAERCVEVGVARRKGRPDALRAAELVCMEYENARWRVSDEREKARLLVASNAARAAKATLEPDAWLSADWASGFAANARAWEWIISHEPDTLPEFNQVAKHPEEQEQILLLRDIVGNPFRPVTAAPSWLTPTVIDIANNVYESRDFSPMPILADALQDAGCDNEEVLNHCRGPGPHLRGCWVVDAVLNKG